MVCGVDWASQAHQVCVLDKGGRCQGQRSFPHSGSGLAQMADWILQQTGTRAEAVSVLIEVPHGPVVEFLMGRCFAVSAINPRQLDRFRDRFSPAGAKDDRRDARVLADAIRTDGDRWQRLEPVDSELIQLREFSRRGAQLTRDRTRLLNRLRQQLWRYYPQFLGLSQDLAEPWVMEVWKLAPTPDAAQKLRPSRVAKVLKKHRIRRIDAPEVLRRLRVRSIPVAPGTTQAIVAHIESLGAQLALVQSQLRDLSRELDRLIRAWEKRCESTPGPQGPSRDVAILASLPGVGRIVLATLLSEAFDPLRRRDYAALRCLCGVAPVTQRSGKYTRVVRRQAVHPRLREAAYHWSRVATQHDPISKAKYAALRERGHGHARALRSVADRLLAVACAMLRTQTKYWSAGWYYSHDQNPTIGQVQVKSPQWFRTNSSFLWNGLAMRRKGIAGYRPPWAMGALAGPTWRFQYAEKRTDNRNRDPGQHWRRGGRAALGTDQGPAGDRGDGKGGRPYSRRTPCAEAPQQRRRQGAQQADRHCLRRCHAGGGTGRDARPRPGHHQEHRSRCDAG